MANENAAGDGLIHHLTPAELERLAIMEEECGEVAQAVGKTIRFGWTDPSSSGVTADDMMHQEIGDLLVVVDWMIKKGDLDPEKLEVAKEKKRKRLPKYLKYNEF